MANGYYTHTSYPATNSSGSSSAMRAELDAIMAGFAMLPNPLGLGQQGFSGGAWTNPTVTGGTIDNAVIGGVAPNAGSFSALNATTNSQTTTLSVTDTGTSGANIKITGDGATTPSKYLRVKSGALQILGSAYGAPIWTLSDVGNMVAAGGIDGTAIGATTRAAGSFTQLNANAGGTLAGTFTGGTFAGGTHTGNTYTGGTIDNIAIGNTTPSTGKFTTLSASGAASLAAVAASSITAATVSATSATIAGGTIDNTVIGGTTRAAGSFLAVAASGYTLGTQATTDSGAFGFSNSNGPSMTAYGSGTANAGALAFGTAGIERARFVSAGRFLLGTATDDGATLLQVNGAAKLLGNGATTPTKTLRANAGVFQVMNDANSAAIFACDDAGNFTATANITGYSDERLKKDWAPFAADFIARLAAVKHGTFTRIDSGARQTGVGAQSLQAVLPEAVIEVDGVLTVAYGQAALAAVVELAREVVALRARVEAL